MPYFKFVLSLCLLPLVQTLLLSEIKGLFGNKNCILGSLLTLKKNQDYQDVKNSQSDFVETIISRTDEDKSAMSFINELAQYNDISYSYELTKEEGPPHNKIFTVTLFLGDEHYASEGKSLKKAQQEAARHALTNTKYEHPPIKLKENDKPLTPIALLNNLATKLGLSVTYTVVTNDILEQVENQNAELEIRPKKSYMQKLNDTVHSNDTIRIRKDGSDLKGPFKVRVDVDGSKFVGEAHTIKTAKHEAAEKALKALRNQESSFNCLKEGDNCKTKKQNNKSPISLVYENAQKRNLGVLFDVIDEVGPSHKKIFTTICRVGEIEATGQGKSKKESKKIAAENILPKLLEIPEAEGTQINVPTNSKKSKKKNKKNKVIKTTFDKIDRMIDDVVDFGKNLIGKIKGNEETNNDDSKHLGNQRNKNKRSPSDEIMQLGKILELALQFSDFTENDKSYSVLDLGTKPSFVCLGEGVNQKNSRDLSAKYGIDVLYKLGLLDNLLDKTMKISNILDKEEDFQKFYLEVVETKEEL